MKNLVCNSKWDFFMSIIGHSFYIKISIAKMSFSDIIKTFNSLNLFKKNVLCVC